MEIVGKYLKPDSNLFSGVAISSVPWFSCRTLLLSSISEYFLRRPRRLTPRKAGGPGPQIRSSLHSRPNSNTSSSPANRSRKKYSATAAARIATASADCCLRCSSAADQPVSAVTAAMRYGSSCFRPGENQCSKMFRRLVFIFCQGLRLCTPPGATPPGPPVRKALFLKKY